MVADNDVWTKLFYADLHVTVLGLGARICAVRYVVEEEFVSSGLAELANAGLRVETVSAAGIEKIAEWRSLHDRPSMGDLSSAALAWENGWTLATHDRPLKAVAESDGITCCGVADLLLMMAEDGLVDEDDISRFKREMHRTQEANYNRRKVKAAERLARQAAS